MMFARKNLSEAMEDYLKVIYHLTLERPRASTTEIAQKLNVTPASVTGMLQRLGTLEPPLVEYHKHRGVSLTSAGQKAALEIVRHHRLLELFLHEQLGYAWDEVHAEADRLEHVISEKMEASIFEALGEPTHDPHGDPIPSADLELPAENTTALSALQTGQTAVVKRVSSETPGLLRHLEALRLVPTARVKVMARSAFDDNLTLQVSGQEQPLVLGKAITQQIFVSRLEL